MENLWKPSGHLHHHLHLNRNIERQFGHADGAAGVPAAVSEQRYQQPGSAVYDRGLLVEARRAVDEAKQLDDALHAIQVADLALEGGQRRQGAEARRLFRLINVDVRANLARDEAAIG